MKDLGKFLFMIFFAIIVFLIAGYFGRYGPAQRNFIQSKVVATVIGRTDDSLLPLLMKHESIIIQFGSGGDVDGMIEVVQYLRLNPNKTVVIDGECYSACTMLLGAPDNILFTYNARLFFHSGYTRLCVDGLMKNLLSPAANRKMLMLFDQDTRNWILQSGAFTSTNFTELPKAIIRDKYWKQWMSLDYVPAHDERKIDELKNAHSDLPEICGYMRIIPNLILPTDRKTEKD